MLRVSLGVTWMERIRNEHIEGQHRSDALETKLERPDPRLTLISSINEYIYLGLRT